MVNGTAAHRGSVRLGEALPAGLPEDIEVQAVLGRGAHATVYRVRRGGVSYALKVLRAAAGEGERLLRGLRREAARLARVDHPGIPKVYEVGLAGDRPYLVMELLDGTSLAEVLEAGVLDEAVLVRVGLEVAGALGAVHAGGMVHRDVNPANVMLTTCGGTRLIDFGLAVRGQREPDDADVVAGTFDYAAPEQTGMLRRGVDGRADLYSLGVVLFECATGTRPFVSDDVGELIRLHATAQPPDPRAGRTDLSPGCAAIITRLLAKDPDDRYQSADELRSALAALVDPAPVGAPDGPSAEAGPADRVRRHNPERARVVGRDGERTELYACWQRTRSGNGGAALVTGATGTGKTTLAGLLTGVARADGALVLAGKCEADQPVPLAPLRTAIDRYARSVAALSGPERSSAVARLSEAAGEGVSLLAPLSSTLAVLLSAAPVLSAEDRSDQLAAALAGFLVRLARRCGAMLLHLDDVQWADAATRRVLRRLAAEVGDAPLLLVATARDGAEYGEALSGFLVDHADVLRARVGLRPLDDSQVAELVSAQLAGSRPGTHLTALLAARGAGNPFATLEYLHALIDAGALAPRWGTWQLDDQLVQDLHLPEDVLDLVLARVDGLGGAQRHIFVTAAAVGTRFRPRLLAAAVDAEPDAVLAAVRGAVGQRLVEAAGPLTADSEVSFVHDRVREALLTGLGAAELRRVHQSIAEAMDRATDSATDRDPQHVYALAGHYAAGEADRTPERVFHTGMAAGLLALTENAAAAAVSFLEPALAAARVAGIRPDSGFHEALGQAYQRTGRLEAAERELRAGLSDEDDPLRRSALYLALATTQQAAWDIDGSLDSCRQGMAQIGHPMPRNPVLLLGTVLWTLMLIVVTGKVGLGRLNRHTPVQKRERIRLLAALNLTAAHSCGVGYLRPIMGVFSIRGGWPAARLGPSSEYVRALIGLGMALYTFRMRRRAGRVFDRARGIALDTLGDPGLAALVAVMQGLGEWISGTDHGETWYRRTEEQRRWLDTGMYLNGTTVHGQYLFERGYAREALALYQHGMTLVAADEVPPGFVHRSTEAMARAMLGDATDAVNLLDELRHNGSANPSRLITVLLAGVQCAYEQGDVGDRFDQAVADFDRLGVVRRAMYPAGRSVFAYVAYGRLAQCVHAATRAPSELPDRLSVAHRAVTELGRAANSPLLRAHHAAARASLLVLRGRPQRALQVLAKAEPAIYGLDAPAIGYEIARVRARALRALGLQPEALRQAGVAHALAQQHGWQYRARWVRSEFDVDEVHSAGRPTRNGSQTGTATADRLGRRLAALQQVSLAAASVLDPHELARVALDQTLAILGAERALLFLAEPDGRPRPAVGRDSAGHDLPEFTGYSSTMVDQVANDREALVVTGTDDGATLGSRSAVVYGLRSIMIAPLEIDNRLLGIVYLDSRIANGIFTHEDVDILLAIAHQVAAALETARAAQLDTAVQVARQQRDLADTLRASMSELNATLDPDEVVRRLLRLVLRTVPADRGCVLLHDGARYQITTTEGTTLLPDAAGSAASLLCDPDAPVRSGVAATPVVDLLGPVGCWLTVPVRTHRLRGVLVVARGTPAEFTESDTEIAAAVVEQGASAYDKAHLFTEVQRLATTDPLTGIANRRHFTERAEHQVGVARRHHRPLVAVMLDIDHFKRINDTYGHATGDDVIRSVAGTFAEHLREHDILGRLGGEEFAAILPETHDDPTTIAERLRAAIEARPCPTPDGAVHVTVSIGLAELKPDETLQALLHRADEALYRAKSGGRNQVRVG